MFGSVNMYLFTISDLKRLHRQTGVIMINENLRKLRKEHNMSQEYVAEQIQVSRQAVAKWESGETMPDIQKCDALAKLYDITVDDLLHYDESQSYQLNIPPKGKHLFGTVTVGERGQIVIPKKARTVFDINPGDDLIVLGDEEQGIGLMKAKVMMDFMNSVNRHRTNDN